VQITNFNTAENLESNPVYSLLKPTVLYQTADFTTSMHEYQQIAKLKAHDFILPTNDYPIICLHINPLKVDCDNAWRHLKIHWTLHTFQRILVLITGRAGKCPNRVKILFNLVSHTRSNVARLGEAVLLWSFISEYTYPSIPLWFVHGSI